EIPTRVDEGVERVGFAHRLAAALRASDMFPGRVAVERVAGLVELDVVGKHDRELVVRDRDRAAFLAMDDWDRRAPITLARHAPVAQPPRDRALAPARGLGAAGALGASTL